MKYFISILRTSTIIILIGQFSCEKNTTEPAPSLRSFISVTGDISESYDVTALFGITTYTSSTSEKEYFTITLIPKAPGNNELAMTLMYKSGPESPVVHSYDIGAYAFGNDIPADGFGGAFSPRNVTDLSGYIMTSGTLSISESSAARISGEFEMSGHYARLAEQDSTRMVNINGKFYATPWPN